MKMKRMISSLLVIVMLCSLLTGCGGNTGGNGGNGKKAGTLKVGVPQKVSVTDYEDNAYTKYIEENTGVDIEFVFFSSTASEYQQQLALMASSKEEFPDVMMGFVGLGSRTVNQYGEDGYFIDLTDLIDKHADTYKEQYNKLSDEVKALVDLRTTSADTGCIYSMPLVTQVLIDNIQSLCFINQTWLDKVGMQQPKTIDELYTVLKAFSTKDPNGNGIADELPMLGLDMIINYVVNAYIYYEQSHPWNIDDGVASAPFITDEYREALKTLNKLCVEGLYSDLSFTVTSSTELKNLHTPATGTANVGVWCGHPSNKTNTTSPILDEYVALAPLAAETDKGGYLVVSEDTVLLGTFITKDCEDPELAMKFIDFFYEDETVRRGRHGEKDVDWEEGSGMDIYGNEVSTVVLNEQAFFEGSQTWSLNMCGIHTPENYNCVSADNNEAGARTTKLLKESYEMISQYPLKAETVRNLEYTTEEDAVKEQYESTITNYVREQTKLFIMGSIDINSDTDWNSYVKQIDELHMKDVLAVKQSAYDRVNGK